MSETEDGWNKEVRDEETEFENRTLDIMKHKTTRVAQINIEQVLKKQKLRREDKKKVNQ